MVAWFYAWFNGVISPRVYFTFFFQKFQFRLSSDRVSGYLTPLTTQYSQEGSLKVCKTSTSFVLQFFRTKCAAKSR